jgi:hypothetical protein
VAIVLAAAIPGAVVYTALGPSSPAWSPAAHFALLRDHAGPAVPAKLAAAARHAPAKFGVTVADAKYARSSGAWLLPGSRGMCIATTDDDGLGMSCAPPAEVEQGRLEFVMRATAGGTVTVVGAVPDGHAEAIAEARDGSVVSRAPVRDNTYRVTGRGIVHTRPSGRPSAWRDGRG